MRTFLLLAVAAALAVPTAALAAESTAGDGSLALSNASGTIYIQGRGVIYGRFDSGTLMILDYHPDDLVSTPSVSSGKAKVKPGAGAYTGTDMRFLLPSGRYTIELIGTGIDASGVGRGSVIVTGLGTFDDGTLALNGGRPQALTRYPTNEFFGATIGSATLTLGRTTS